MGVRNVLILFFSAMAVSVVILTVFFSLFFKNFDNLVTFDTRLPESAPELGNIYNENGANQSSKAEGVVHSTINVPEDYRKNGNTTPQAPQEDPMVGVGADTVNPEDSQDTEEALNSDTTKEEDPAPPALEPPAREVKKAAVPNKPPSAPKPAAPDQTVPKLPPMPPAPVPAAPTQENTPVRVDKTGMHQVYLDGFASAEAAKKTADELKTQGIRALVRQQGTQAVLQLGTFSNKDFAEGLAGRVGGKVKSSP